MNRFSLTNVSSPAAAIAALQPSPENLKPLMSPTTERTLARLNDKRPLGGGSDLLGEIKDGLIAPATLVNLKPVTDWYGIRAELDGNARDRRNHDDCRRGGIGRCAQALPCPRGRGRGSRFAANPQPGHRRRQSLPASPLLVLSQCRHRVSQKGRKRLFRARRREQVPRDFRCGRAPA